jgi:hypothetical protein
MAKTKLLVIMHLIGNNNTRRLLKKYSITPFWCPKRHFRNGFNQSGQGLNLFGKFEEGKLHDVDIVKILKSFT